MLRLDKEDYLLSKLGSGVESSAHRLYTPWGDPTDAVLKVSSGGRDGTLDYEAMDRGVLAREKPLPVPQGWFEPAPGARTLGLDKPFWSRPGGGTFEYENQLPFYSQYRGDAISGAPQFHWARRGEWDFDEQYELSYRPRKDNVFTLQQYSEGYSMPRDKGLMTEMWERAKQLGRGMYGDAHGNQFGLVDGRMVSIDRDLRPVGTKHMLERFTVVDNLPEWARTETIEFKRPSARITPTMSPAADPLTEPAFNAMSQSAARREVALFGKKVDKATLLSTGDTQATARLRSVAQSKDEL